MQALGKIKAIATHINNVSLLHGPDIVCLTVCFSGSAGQEADGADVEADRRAESHRCALHPPVAFKRLLNAPCQARWAARLWWPPAAG